MSNQYPLPDSEKVKQTVIKLRQTRREIEEFGLELAEINALLEQIMRHLLMYEYWQTERKYNKNHWEAEIISFLPYLLDNSQGILD